MWEDIKTSKDKIADRNNALEERTSELETANLDLKTLLETLRHAQTQLVQSEKMAAIGSLVAGVSHEINTPLGISITATSYLEEKLKKFVDLFQSNKMKKSDLENYLSISTETVAMIMSNLQRASELVKSFKQVAVDQSTEQKRNFNVKSYINEILLSLSPKLKKTKHNIVVRCEDTIEIYSFPGALYQVITNLIMNSIMHAYDDGEEGNILIDVSTQNDNLILKYIDDGKGIDSKIIGKIFNPFFTTKRNKGGTGLGLHISYSIVKQTLGGNMECSSQPGNGTTFIINIPLREEMEHE
jgi:signal transduction histidine kinase